MITALDHESGRVMEHLEWTGAIDNTIVVYTSDHGERLCTDGSLRGKSRAMRNIDPLEQLNFVDDPAYADVRERLHERLMGFVERRRECIEKTEDGA